MTRTDSPAPGTRTTEMLPALPGEIVAALAEAGGSFDLARAVPEPQGAPVLRWGILGAGHIAGSFARDVPAYSSGLVTAVGSRDAARARSLIEAHPGAGKGEAVRAHGSYEDLVSDPDVDAVYVATPHAFHADHALLALEAGKPVLVEKAFARSAVEARRVLGAARHRGLFAMEAMWMRFLPGQALVRALAVCGALGAIEHVRADHFQPLLHVERLTRPDLAGGALLDLGVYPLSLVHSVLGAPLRVAAVGRLSEAGVDLDEVVGLVYPGATAAAASGMSAASGTSAEIIGSRARIALAGRFYAPTTVRVVWNDDGGRRAAWDGRVPGGFQFEAAEAARCLAAGATESATLPWAATLEVMEIMDEVRRQIGVVYPGE